jgi:hypothetical protein
LFGFAYEKSDAALLIVKCTKDARKMSGRWGSD